MVAARRGTRRAGTAAPAEAEGRAGDDDEHGRRGRARGHADDVRAGQRVAGQALEHRAGQAEQGPDQRPRHSARGSRSVMSDEVGLGRAPADDARAAARAAGTAKSPTETETSRTATQATASATDTTTARARPVVRVRRTTARTAGRRRRTGRRCPGQAGAAGGASRLIGSHLRQRPAADQGDEDRGADQRGDEADLQLGRAGDDPAEDVGQQQRATGARTADQASTQRVAGPVIARAACGTVSPTKPIGPAAAVAPPTSRTTASAHTTRTAPTLAPSDAGHVVAHGEHVERAAAQHREDHADDDERRHLRGDGQVAPGRRDPTTQNRYDVEGREVDEQDARGGRGEERRHRGPGQRELDRRGPVAARRAERVDRRPR